ncbi:MAG: PqqD family peptide modification chaperone [Methylococcaceae bacterium]
MNCLIEPTHYTLFPLASSTVVVREAVTQLFLLNETASLLWQQLSKGVSVTQISQQWSEQFGITTTQALQDIENALAFWHSEGLLGALPPPFPAFTPLSTALTIPLPVLPLQLQYRVGNCVIQIHLNQAQLAHTIDAIFAYLSDKTTQTVDVVFKVWQQSHTYYLVKDDAVFVEKGTFDNLINHLHYQILQHAIALSDYLSVLHAGAVSRNGRCLVLAGCGGAGKSTLTAALLTRGFQYFCDDLVPLATNTLQIMVLPVPLTIKEPSWSLLQPYYANLLELPCYVRNAKKVRYLPPPISQCPKPQTVSYLLFPRIAQTAQLRRLNAQECLQALLAANMALPQTFSSDNIAQLLAWVENTPAYEIAYEQLETALALIEQLCKQ